MISDIILLEVIVMENEKRNQYIVIGIILMLLIVVISFIIISLLGNKKETENVSSVKLQQIYSSDYKLSILSDKYFIGTYDNNKISIIIDSNGKEIYNGLEDIYYEGIYMLKDGNYLIYNNLNNALNTYIFDGNNISTYYKIDNIKNAKPLIYSNKGQEYIIGFIEKNENSSNLIPLDNTGFIVLDNQEFIGDKETDETIITYNENYFVVQNSDKLYGVVNRAGDVIIDFKYQNMINTYNNSFIAQNTKGKYGIVDKDGNTLMKFNYKVIDGYENYFLVVNNQNKMVLFNSDYDNLTGYSMEYDDLIRYDFRNKNNSIKLEVIGNYLGIVNNVNENLNGTEYNKHNLYVLLDNKITENIKEVAYGVGDIIYTMDKNKVITIYNKKFESVSTINVDDLNKVESILYVTDNIVKIAYLDNESEKKLAFYNLDGELVDNLYGDFIFKNAIYSGYIDDYGSSLKLKLYDSEMNNILEVSGSYIDIEKEFVIIDNSIYKIIVS